MNPDPVRTSDGEYEFPEDAINFYKFGENLKLLRRKDVVQFKNITSIQSRLLREDGFYHLYYRDAMQNVMEEHSKLRIDPNIASSMYFLMYHEYEQPFHDEWSEMAEYYIKNEINTLTGISLNDFFAMTPEMNYKLRKVVDKVNRERVKAHEKAEKETQQEMKLTQEKGN